MRINYGRTRISSAFALTTLTCLFFFPIHASAHVKWFAEYNLLIPPRSLPEIVSGVYFLPFCLFSGSVMFAVSYIDQYLVKSPGRLSECAASVARFIQPLSPVILRMGVCVFFIAVAAYGEFILTPELKTEEGWVFALQLAIAVLVLLPLTAIFAGVAIIALYIHAAAQYGLYHLLDYPIFIGVAVFIVLSSFGPGLCSAAHNSLRWCTGVTLMWAGIEKFGYPQWSFTLLKENPELTFGFDYEFYMVAAGFVEFCCAYLLITGVLSARVAALLLLFLFTSAIYYFGLIDAIGHSVIIIVLALLVLSNNQVHAIFRCCGLLKIAAIHTVLFFGCLLLFLALYTVCHKYL